MFTHYRTKRPCPLPTSSTISSTINIRSIEALKYLLSTGYMLGISYIFEFVTVM